MLKSKSIKPITYVGYTNDLKKRINLHNSGKGAKFTRGRKWILLYKEKFKSKISVHATYKIDAVSSSPIQYVNGCSEIVEVL
mgnify:CR=1 FL=1